MLEFVVVLAFGVLLFIGVRMFLRRGAQKMNTRLQEEITPENARTAVLALDDEQHKTVYRAIAAEDGRQALTVYQQATGASIRDAVIAVQALHRYPQSPPSEIRFAEGFNLNEDASEQVQDESLEDAIDDLREDMEDDDAVTEDTGPIAEADPNTGQIVGENPTEVPDIPGGDDAQRGAEPLNEEELDERARELLAQSRFDLDQELTIPEEWAASDEDQAGFHLEVERAGEKITLSHEDLEPWVHDQLYALLRDDHVDEAAQLLADHSPLTREEAHRFLTVFKNQS